MPSKRGWPSRRAWILFVVSTVVGTWNSSAGLASEPGSPDSLSGSVSTTSAIDTVFTAPTIIVRAKAIAPQLRILDLPGQAVWIDLEDIHPDVTNVAQVLDALPGLDVRHYGGFSGFSSVSIRGSTSSQVSIYLDGVPLTQAGLGIVNLSELPFASLDHIEVYRGFAPPELPGAGMGGAINLVTRKTPGSRSGAAFSLHRPRIVAGTGSFGTRRWGISQSAVFDSWSATTVADITRSAGDFEFHDDNGTWKNPHDDQTTRRLNNWTRNEEYLIKLHRSFDFGPTLNMVNQTVQHGQGIAGHSSNQASHARTRSAYNLSSATWSWPGLWRGRYNLQSRLYFDWRRDEFLDAENEIGLGAQDNRDETRTWGVHLSQEAHLPLRQSLGLHVEVRREAFVARRDEVAQPRQRRAQVEAALQHKLHLRPSVTLFSGLTWTVQSDRFEPVKTPHSRSAAQSANRRFLEPQLGLRWQCTRHLAFKTHYGRYHRSPGFFELFGDGGSTAGSTDLLAEEGTNRDYSLEWHQETRWLQGYFHFSHFRNRADHLIVFLPQSQRTLVARNISRASMHGEEYAWSIADATGLWSYKGSLTKQRTRDLGEIVYYAGKTLPGRPATKFHSKFSLGLSAFKVSYTFDHLAQNYLDRFNDQLVQEREIHGLSASWRHRLATIQLGLHNLTDNRAVDVSGFPVPGRTFSLSVAFGD